LHFCEFLQTISHPSTATTKMHFSRRRQNRIRKMVTMCSEMCSTYQQYEEQRHRERIDTTTGTKAEQSTATPPSVDNKQKELSQLLSMSIQKRRSLQRQKQRDFGREVLLTATITRLCEQIGQIRAERKVAKRKRRMESVCFTCNSLSHNLIAHNLQSFDEQPMKIARVPSGDHMTDDGTEEEEQQIENVNTGSLLLHFAMFIIFTNSLLIDMTKCNQFVKEQTFNFVQTELQQHYNIAIL
jgi:hypothetical protein